MQCPFCKKEIGTVRVISEVWQRAILKGKKIVDYEEQQPIDDSIKKIECPECYRNLEMIIDLGVLGNES